MPWTGQGGGGGPWKPGNQGPWGQGPSGPQTPPDLEELLRRSQDKLKQIMPGGRPPGGAMTALLVLAAVALWGLYCLGLGYFYVVLAFAGMWLVDRLGGFHSAA